MRSLAVEFIEFWCLCIHHALQSGPQCMFCVDVAADMHVDSTLRHSAATVCGCQVDGRSMTLFAAFIWSLSSETATTGLLYV